jgi:protein-S-isoprenylcysteine O-methyltransferase Ste14
MGFVETLVGWSRRETGTTYKLLSLAAGSLFFLCLLPGLLTWIGVVVGFPPVSISPLTAALVITLGLASGASLLGWATLTQWQRGRGTPAPVAPTARLIVEGPYRLCRNPIELGAILFYLGFGTLFGSLGAGLFASLGALILGSAYHRFVEERELLARFGDDYRRYRARTPFLIPSLSAYLDRHR